MDVNELRVIVTLLSFVAFAGIVGWAWSRRNAARFTEAAQLPFVDEESPRAERRARATKGPLRGPTKPARIPSGDRPMYSSDEGCQP
jgi:cytochrome c oxidase cbb3-type subunit 4